MYFIHTFLFWNNNNLCSGHSPSKNLMLEDNYLATVMHQEAATPAWTGSVPSGKRNPEPGIEDAMGQTPDPRRIFSLQAALSPQSCAPL